MIYLYFGDDKVQIRAKLQQQLLKYDPNSIQHVVSKSIDSQQINDLLRARSMFGSKRVVVVEGKVDAKEIAWELVEAEDAECDLLICVEGMVKMNEGLYKVVLERKGTIEKCELEPERDIFTYLEAILRRDRGAAVEELEKLFALGKEPIYIHTMLVWQFRQLLAPGLLKPFLQKKANTARNSYSEDELIKIYKSLLQVDVQLKTGAGEPKAWLTSLTVKITR